MNLPNPPGRKVTRDYAGGFGIATPLSRIRRKHSGRPYLNLFLPYSAAVANEAGSEYQILDAQAFELSRRDILRWVKKFDPDMVFSMISLPSIYSDKKILHSVKKELPNSLVAGCGSVCNTVPEEILRDGSIDIAAYDSFPYVNSLRTLLLEYKETADFKKLLGFSWLDNGKLRTNPPMQKREEFTRYAPIYDNLPLEQYEYVETAGGNTYLHIPILGSVGCPFPCVYCPYPIGFGKKVILKDPTTVADEIEHLNQRGIRYFDFRNQSFTLDQKWANEVCHEIEKRKLDIMWLCEARVNETDESSLSSMRNAGCERINYGVETGDPLLIQTGKPGVTLQNTRDSFKKAMELGIWRHAHIILGLPGENIKTLKATVDFLQDIEPDSVTLNHATPYPGTKLYEIAEKSNWILTHDWSKYSSFDVTMRVPGLCLEDVYKTAWTIERNLILHKARKFSRAESVPSKLRIIADQYIRIVSGYLLLKKRLRGLKFLKKGNNCAR